MDTNQQLYEKTNRYFALAVIAALGVFLLFSLSIFLNSFLGAVIMYILTKPVLFWFVEKRKWGVTWSTITVMLLSFLILLVPIMGIGYMLTTKLVSLTANINEYTNFFRKIEAYSLEKAHITLLSDDTIRSIKSFVSSLVSMLLTQTVNTVTSIAMMYFMLFFMLKSNREMEKKIISYLPYSDENIQLFSKEITAQTYSNALITPLMAVIQGITASIGYWIFGVEDAIFWGMMTGVFTFIPIVGCTIIWIPLGLSMIASGNSFGGIGVFLYTIILTTNVDNLLRISLQKRFADVHPLITVLGLLIGINYFGVSGIIFGPLLISLFLLMLKLFVKEYFKPNEVISV
jgi:predicted PurR-regulated permease PerM